jgi:hypothetical protein
MAYGRTSADYAGVLNGTRMGRARGTGGSGAHRADASGGVVAAGERDGAHGDFGVLEVTARLQRSRHGCNDIPAT